MALKTRIVLGIAAIMALSLVAVLPPGSCEDSALDTMTAIVACGGLRHERRITHAEVLQATSNRLWARLDLLELGDSVRALARAGRGVRSPDGSVVVLYEAPITADSARTWLNLAIGERDRVHGDRLRAHIIVALQSNPGRVEPQPGPQAARTYRRAVARFVSVAAGDTACVVALRLGRNWTNWGNLQATDRAGRYGSFLGWCGLAARHGIPGRAINPGLRAAFDDAWIFYSFWSTVVRPEDEHPVIEEAYVDYHFLSCAKGDVAACPVVVGLGRLDRDVAGYSRARLMRNFFSWLAAEKTVAFDQFWHASGSPGAALEQAFGQPSGVLVRDWLQQTYRITQAPDVRPRREMVLAAAGWLSAALIAAFAIGMRRQASL